MNTLYISDLDGTLLNSSAELSDYTVATINRLIKCGMNFSIATARTAATAEKIIERLNLNLPIVLMNGVIVYDIAARAIIKTEVISRATAEKMLAVLAAHDITGFLYTMEGGEQLTYYENLDVPHRKAFHDERVLKFGKSFVKVDSFTEQLDKDIIYYSVCDKHDVLERVCEGLRRDENLNVEFYRDVYHEDFWYLEICSATASKFNAVSFQRENYGFERVISFGDNLNDLPMFAASEECYAVSNAKKEVKVKASAVISSNDEDGVAHFLEKAFTINN